MVLICLQTTTSFTATTTHTTSRTNTPRWPVIRWGNSSYGYGSVYGLATDSEGSVYATGDEYQSLVEFSPGVTAYVGTKGYLVKFDDFGYTLWATNTTSFYLRYVFTFRSSRFCSLMLSPHFRLVMSKDENLLYGMDKSQVHAHSTRDGSLLWSTPVGFEPEAADADPSDGSIVVGGEFRGASYSLGPIPIAITASTVPIPIFVKLNLNGTITWAQVLDGGQGTTTGIAM
jgi:hypothetical protein